MLRLLDSLPLALFLLKATVLLLAATLIAAALRRAPAGARYVVWLMTLAAVVLFPALVRWSPLRLEVLPPIAAASAAPASASVAGAPSTIEAPVAPSLTPAAVAESPAPQAPVRALPAMSAWDIVVVAWLTVVVALLGWLAAGALSVHRIVRTGRKLDKDPRWAGPLCEVADRLDLADIPHLVASDRVEMPFACGVFRPTIVFPASADSWTDERRRVVLFHELAHIKRRDLLGHSLGRIACALYWFHPLVWGAARRLRDESEKACDDLVLACGARATDYATHLLDIITGVRRHGAPATALPMARRREFEGRMLAILDPAIQRGTAGRLRSAAVVAGVAALTLSVAAAAPASASKEASIALAAVPETTVVDRGRNLENEGASRSTREPDEVEAQDVTPEVAAAVGKAVPEAVAAAVAQATTTAVSTETGTTISRAVENAVHQYTSKEKYSSKDKESAAPEDSASRQQRVAALSAVLRGDRDASVRKSAAWGLAHVRSADAVNALIGALRQDSDEEVREMAAWGIASVNADDADGALAAALRRDPSDEVRETAAWALAHREGPAATVALLRALGDSSTKVRHSVVWALGHRQLGEAPKGLVALIDDPDPELRLMAVWALTQIGDRAVVPRLRVLFGDERDPEVRRATFRALAMMGDRTPEFIDLAMNSSDPDLRARAVRMLAGQGLGAWPWPWPWPRPRPSP